MNDRLGPSRIGEVLDPVILVGTLIATFGAAGLGLSYDPDRTMATIVIVFYVVLFASLVLVAPYFDSMGRQAIKPGFPLIGVRAAATGCAGLVVLVGLALSRPLPPLVGGLALAAGLVAIGIDLGARRDLQPSRRAPPRSGFMDELVDHSDGGRMADRIMAAVGSLAFLVVAPGVVAGLIPWLITDWQPLPPGDWPGAVRWTGVILIAAGLAVVLEAFARFAWEGLGTPAPVAPTRTLLVSGFYRFVRNPIYVAVAAMIFGQAVLFASWGVALYGVVIVAAFDTFVRLYEEPTLRQAHGEEYAAYCAAVPRWIPRFRR